jgi:hypothetical protein
MQSPIVLTETGFELGLSPASLGLSCRGQFASDTAQNAVNATLDVRF